MSILQNPPTLSNTGCAPALRDYQGKAIARIPLAGLIVDPARQSDKPKLFEPHVRLLLESDPATWPPLLVAPIGEERFVVLDGSHRREAAIRLGLPSLLCFVDEATGRPEAVAAAGGAYGLPLTVSDRKHAACWYADHRPGLSYREIGWLVGLSDETVAEAIMAGGWPRSQVFPDPVAWLVSRLLKPYDSDITRVRRLQREIDTYDDDARPDVAASLAAVGQACLDAAAHHLEKPKPRIAAKRSPGPRR